MILFVYLCKKIMEMVFHQKDSDLHFQMLILMPMHLPMDSLIQTLTGLSLPTVTQIPRLTGWLILMPTDLPIRMLIGWLIRILILTLTRMPTDSDLPMEMLIPMQILKPILKPTDSSWLILMPMD